MKIMYVTADESSNPASENNGYYLRRALEQHGAELVAYHATPLTTVEKLVLGAPKLVVERFGKEIRASLTPMVTRRRARDLNHAVERVGPDVVLANSPAVLYGLESRVPQVLYSDAPISALVAMGSYYDHWIGWYRKHFVDIDVDVLRHVTIAIYHSDWAVQQAVCSYGLPESRFRTILPGANFEFVEPDDSSVLRERTSRCELLFWGRDWERKGGPVAVATVEAMRESGVNAHLTVCGPSDLHPDIVKLPYVTFNGYMKKDTAADKAALAQLFKEMDYMLLPCQAEASTAAIREGAAFGVPSVATTVGGLSDLTTNGRSGILFDPPGNPREIASAILGNWCSDARRLDMRRCARERYESALNWRVAASSIMEVMDQLVAA